MLYAEPTGMSLKDFRNVIDNDCSYESVLLFA